MRSLPFLLCILGLVSVAGCSTPVEPPVVPTSPPPIVLDNGDLRLPAGLPPLRQGEIPSFPIFADTVTNMTEGGSHRETSLALSPVDSALVFACDPSGVPNISGGHSYYYISRNNGTTWSDLQIETEMTDPRKATFEGGDCDVAIDAAGTLYSADSWLGSIAVGSSKDAGLTWTVGQPAAGSGPIADRPWIVGGPAGTVYMTYQDVQFGMPSVIWFTKSTDYGLTFLPAVPVATAMPDGAFTWTGNLEVAASGQDMYSVYTRRPSQSATQFGTDPESVWVAASHDGGLTWTSHKVSDRPAAASYLYPSIGLDDGGQLHVVFAQRDAQGQPVWYSHSGDQAATWTEPVALVSGTSGYSPWVAGGKAGQAIAIWYGSPNPDASFSQEEDWFLYWARVENGTILAGTTTAAPVFQGKQGAFAEFNMVRLDAAGNAHVGASIMQGEGNNVHWQAVYQRQVLGPAT